MDDRVHGSIVVKKDVHARAGIHLGWTRVLTSLTLAFLWAGLGLGGVGCFGAGRSHRTLVSSDGGRRVLDLVLDVGARPTEVFVDGTRMTRFCRKAGRMLRCHVTGLSKRLHRLDIQMDGRPVVRCVTDGRAVAKCCRGCDKPPSEHDSEK